MEENTIFNPSENKPVIKSDNSAMQISGAILLSGIIIAGAILLKGNMSASPSGETVKEAGIVAPAMVSNDDKTLGDANAEVTLILYEDFQCPFCGKFAEESEEIIRNTYVRDGSVRFVYRDFAFLGPESVRAAEAARCAGDQGKFWEYHDYLFTHQNGENNGAFADPNLKTFAVSVGLNASSFNQCMDGEKYAKAVADSTLEGHDAGVNGTPKGFILKGDKVVSTIDGAEPFSMVKTKLDAALK
jgi:protein-disulfide isomerase